MRTANAAANPSRARCEARFETTIEFHVALCCFPGISRVEPDVEGPRPNPPAAQWCAASFEVQIRYVTDGFDPVGIPTVAPILLDARDLSFPERGSLRPRRQICQTFWIRDTLDLKLVQLDEQLLLINRLSQGSWFGRMPLALRELVIARSRVRTYAKGQLLSIEGSPPKGLFAVLEGQVHVVATLASGDEALIHVAEPGFWLGEFGVLAGTPTLATFVAHSKVRALFFPKNQFDLIVDEEPRYYRYFAHLVFERYAALLRAFVEVQEVTPDVRLRRRLSAMAQLQQSVRASAGPVTLRVTQAELSRMIGVSRQTLNGLLNGLQQQGLLELGFRRITVIDPSRIGEVMERPEAEHQSAATGPQGVPSQSHKSV